MDDTGFLTLLMNVAGPILLGVIIAYALISTRRLRRDSAAQNKMDRATEAVYEAEEEEVHRQERGGQDDVRRVSRR
jgi:hypothetical protein